MESIEHVATEALQVFTPQMAWYYRMLPFRKGEVLSCYGEEGGSYEQVSEEAAVICGIPIRLSYLPKEKLERLLNQYYKQEQSGKTATLASPNFQPGQGANGETFFTKLVGDAFQAYASDIHFEAYENNCRIRFRIDGKLVEKYILEKGQYASLVNQIKIMANLDISEKRLPQDGRILYNRQNGKFDVRVSSLPAIYGEKMVLRLLTRHVELLEIENLGFTERQKQDYLQAVSKYHGLVLISGPTGSGKSTTLYATVIKLNHSTNNILTIEDPVEYTLDGINQVQLKEEIGLTFPSALRTFLRQDPDIIMLGEIRDPDTAQMAIRSSLTGHLILSTIHANSAWGSISRLVDMGIHPHLISSTLVLCVAQRLIRTLCPDCKGSGCGECYYTGYRGRRAIYEVIPIDKSLQEAIRNAQNDVSELLAGKGITTLKDSAMQLYESGFTTLEEIYPIIQQQD